MVLCECKYHKDKITTAVIPEIEKKKRLFPLPKGSTLETALISCYGPDQALRESGYFNHSVTLEDIFQGEAYDG